jgi:2-methylaconitate cis-trans-isomerase PrpF
MSLHQLPNMTALPAKIIRGGSSKGVYLDIRDLPPSGAARDEIIMKGFGSPDQRQIDGLGGADKLTSKLAVMGPSTREDCDVDYLFGQVGIELPRIDWKSNCGNISSGAALWGALQGMGRTLGDHMEVFVHQVNVGRRIRCVVPICDGVPATVGDFSIGGVPGTGARIDLDFFDFAGSALGGDVLPTGNAVDRFDIPGTGLLEASIVDMANFHIFVRAVDIGLDPTRSIYDLQEDKALVARLEAVRKVVSEELDFISGTTADEDLKVSMNPLIFAVSPPTTYKATNALNVLASEQDITARSLARFSFSKAYPGSGSVGTAIACGIPETIAAEAFNGDIGGSSYSVRIGHPGGILEVSAEIHTEGASVIVDQAKLGRTARLIMDGTCYIR